MPHLDQGNPAITAELDDNERKVMKEFFLLSSKRTIFCLQRLGG